MDSTEPKLFLRSRFHVRGHVKDVKDYRRLEMSGASLLLALSTRDNSGAFRPPRRSTVAAGLLHAAAWSSAEMRGVVRTSIGGGADQIQRKIISERVLGLLKGHEPDRGIPFRDVLKGNVYVPPR